MEIKSLLPLTTKRMDLMRLNGARGAVETDLVAVEEPLEIRVNGEPLAVTMRTPGHDEELCAGWLVAEGVLHGATELAEIGASDALAANVVEAHLAPAAGLDAARLKRNFYSTSACGVCGKATIEAVTVRSARIDTDLVANAEVVASLPARLARGQGAFSRTGGLHAAGLFTVQGDEIVVREDVGRHNALDKAIGWALLNDRLPLEETLICVSGRLSFELVQKAALAGAPLLAGISAPTSLAIELAAARGVTLCGFVRGGQLNIYAHPGRVAA